VPDSTVKSENVSNLTLAGLRPMPPTEGVLSALRIPSWQWKGKGNRGRGHLRRMTKAVPFSAVNAPSNILCFMLYFCVTSHFCVWQHEYQLYACTLCRWRDCPSCRYHFESSKLRSIWACGFHRRVAEGLAFVRTNFIWQFYALYKSTFTLLYLLLTGWPESKCIKWDGCWQSQRFLEL